MTDRELLELAAKAAGLEFTVEPQMTDYGRNDWTKEVPHANGDPWNPLTDDGDALRLAVKLQIAVFPPEQQGNPGAVANGPGRDAPWIEETGADHCAATRRAIVRAAAEIGKEMP